MEFHPKASLFPLMEGDEFEVLIADIAEHGQLEPIWLYEGMVLDGRNRWRACERLGLVPETRQWDGNDPEAFVISLNLHRRHLTKEQRDAIIRTQRKNGRTLQQIAEMVGVSVGTAHNVTRDLIFNSEIENERGQMRPMQYAPRQSRDELKECDKCGGTWMADIPYCPYCNVSREARVWHAQQERKHVHVAQNSGNNEWYTPPEYIEAAYETMDGIDLDPASSDAADVIVGAHTYYTIEDDGLMHEWRGRVWMNPPYATPLIGQFADKLALHVRAGDVSEACVLVNNATETGWFNTMLDLATCVCFIRGRVKFLDAAGNPSGAPLQGQAVLYIGSNADRFERAFAGFGTILYARRDSE